MFLFKHFQSLIHGSRMIVARSMKTMYHSLDKLKADIVQKFVEKVSKSMAKINKPEWTISLQQTTIDDLKIKCGGNKQYSRRSCLGNNGIEMKKEESFKGLKSKLPEFYNWLRFLLTQKILIVFTALALCW